MQLWKRANPTIFRVSQKAWICKRADGLIPVWIQRPEDEENWWYNLGLKAGMLETQEEPVFPFEYKSRENKTNKNILVQRQERILSSLRESQSFCSIHAFNWLDEAHPD